jgi:P27 family predicted phage terminase small subunit
MSRRPTPTAILRLQGGRVRGRTGEPTLASVQKLRCPNDLSPVGKAYWRALVKHLAGLRVLAESDGPILRLACLAHSDAVVAREHVAEHGVLITGQSPSGAATLTANPACRLASDADKRLRLCLMELGLTPAARAKVKVAPKEPRTDAFSFLSES